MRKARGIIHVADTIVWWLISLLPVLFYAIQLIGHSGQYESLFVYLQNYWGAIPYGIFKTLVDAFLNAFSLNTYVPINNIFYWFVFAQFMHLVVDICLFFVRLIQKTMAKACED